MYTTVNLLKQNKPSAVYLTTKCYLSQQNGNGKDRKLAMINSKIRGKIQ